MGAHFDKSGQFQSDKYPTCPPGKVPLSVRDKTAQDLLWEYANRRSKVDEEFSDDLRSALIVEGFGPIPPRPYDEMLSTNAVLARLRSLVADDMSHTDTVNCIWIWIEELEAGKPTR